MNTLRTGVFVLFLLLKPVSCKVFFTDIVICYFLDAFLILYCIIATILFAREKFWKLHRARVSKQEKNNGIYQELERPKDADPYDVLEPSKKKKKAGKKKKSEPKPVQKDKDPYETLRTNDPPPAQSPH